MSLTTEPQAIPPTVTYSWWSRNQRKVIPYIFIAPTMLIFIVFVFLPISYAAAMSFFDWNGIGTPEFINFKNYTDLFSDPIFWIALKNTVLYSLGVVPVSMALGLLAAIGLNRKNPGIKTVTAVSF